MIGKKKGKNIKEKEIKKEKEKTDRSSERQTDRKQTYRHTQGDTGPRYNVPKEERIMRI